MISFVMMFDMFVYTFFGCVSEEWERLRWFVGGVGSFFCFFFGGGGGGGGGYICTSVSINVFVYMSNEMKRTKIIDRQSVG